MTQRLLTDGFRATIKTGMLRGSLAWWGLAFGRVAKPMIFCSDSVTLGPLGADRNSQPTIVV